MKKILTLILSTLILQACGEQPKSPAKEQQRFSFKRNYVYPGSPEFVYDHLTGDISDWWDHSFSENPFKMYIEAKPGGGFYEIFDESGDGVLHATVIGAERGKMLRMDGALGLAGQALTLVTTYHLSPQGADSTALLLTVHAAGEISEGIPGIVDRVWHHFLGERFTPYIDSIVKHSPGEE